MFEEGERENEVPCAREFWTPQLMRMKLSLVRDTLSLMLIRATLSGLVSEPRTNHDHYCLGTDIFLTIKHWVRSTILDNDFRFSID